MQVTKKILFGLLITMAAFSCKKEDSSTSGNSMKFQFRFDANQARLNNLGLPASIPAGNAAQTPDFHGMSVHYIELVPDIWTQYGTGFVAYKGPELMINGEKAIDFDNNIVSDENKIFQTVSLKNVPPGTYRFIRASVAYQNYDVVYNINNIPIIGNLLNQHGTVASFVGFNTYIKNITPKTKTLAVNGAKKQGFWAFETSLSAPYDAYNDIYSGEAPAGATTVVNPLAATSPIPPGSCVVTGQLTQPLVITGNETQDITVTMSFSINKSFEWIDYNGNGKLDLDASNPNANDKIVDMGLRGMIPSWE